MTRLDIFRQYRSEYFSVWIDSDSDPGQWCREYPGMNDPLRIYWLPEIIDKFVIPQMVVKYLFFETPVKKPPWDISSWMLGLS